MMAKRLRRSASSAIRTHITNITLITPENHKFQIAVSGNQSIEEALVKAVGPDASQMIIMEEDEEGAPLNGNASVAILRKNSILRLIQQSSKPAGCLQRFLEEEKIYGLILSTCIKRYGKPLLAAKIINEDQYTALFFHLESVCQASSSFCIRLEKYIEEGLIKDTSDPEDQVEYCTPEHKVALNILEELLHEGILNQKDIPNTEPVNVSPKESKRPLPNVSPITNRPPDTFYKCYGQASSELDLGFRVQWKFIDDNAETEENPDYDTIIPIQKSFSDEALYNDDLYESVNIFPESCDKTPYESIEELYQCINRDEGEEQMEAKEEETKDEKEKDEEELLLEQLVSGELLDCYSDMIQHWPRTSRLLWSLENKHAGQLKLLKGAALYTLREYFNLLMERLSQYERLVQNSASSSVRRRGQRLSDLERIQGLFPNDYLALHHHDVLQATTPTIKCKTARKRPSINQMIGSPEVVQHDTRQFVMEAPCQISLVSGVTNSDSSQERHLFLFTDLLIVAKSRGNNTFKLKEAVRLCEAWASSDESDTSFLLGWAGQPTPVTYTIMYPTQAARDSWLRKIQNSISSQLLAEPKSTNIQLYFKDLCTGTECSKMMSVTPDMTASMITRQALQLIFGAVISENDQVLKDFCLWVKGSRDGLPFLLLGCERPHAIQMSKLRQILSNEDGFDMNHINSKNNPCEIVFELRKLNKQPNRVKTPLKLFRRSSGKLFGVALVQLCPTGTLPPVVLSMLKIVYRRGPHTQGIFRKSANVKALKNLREKIDNLGPGKSGNTVRLPELDNSPVLLVASLLKDFLRSLPQPVMCDYLYSSWIAVLKMGPKEKIASIQDLLLKLPRAHFNLLSHFIALLVAIARKSSINLMCPSNLAVCVGPSLLWHIQHSDTAPKAVPPLIELLITHAEILFGHQILNIFNKPNMVPSATLSLDSGAEESDSLNSVGLSMDSLDLNCNKKEKLSLSRDSGLTMSEDDSHSNGGNSPAPRFGQNHLVLPHLQVHQAQRIYPSKYYDPNFQNPPLPKLKTDINYSTPPNSNRMSNNVESFYNENLYGNKLDVQRTIDMQQKIYKTIAEQNKIIHSQNKGQEMYGTSCMASKLLINNRNPGAGSSPSKYLTGLEPEKPPRLGITNMQRNSNCKNMYVDVNTPPQRLYQRAKSSDDILERGDTNLYSNLNATKRQTKPENIYNTAINTNNSPQTYCRVYQGWEHRLSNTKNTPNQQMRRNHKENAFASVSANNTPDNCNNITSPKSFTRKDWSRQASRTKSLEGSNSPPTGDNKQTESPLYDTRTNDIVTCSMRMVDPSHYCTRRCILGNKTFYENPIIPATSTKSPKSSAMNRFRELDNKGDFNGRLIHSKSLANIILDGNDALYQPSNYLVTDSPLSSEHSSSNNYNVEYADNIYYKIDDQNRNKYQEKPYSGYKKVPPVPPRKTSHHKLLNLDDNKFQPHFSENRSQLKVNGKISLDRNENMKCSFVPTYLKNKSKSFVLALEDSPSDTESESYV